MPADFTPTLNGYTGQSKLRFWCQKVLPLVYDDSLSYYELLNKVVLYLNNTIEDVSACEDNIVALRDAFVQLQDYVNERIDDFAPEVEQIIDDMIDSGEFDEILANVVNGLIANEYSTTQGYAQFDYVLKDGKLYCATASTSGEWDSTKWRETTVGEDMQILNQRVFNLNAGQVAFNGSAEYDNNTVGQKLKDLNTDADAIKASIAQTYNTDTAYNAGDYAYKPSDGKLYRCVQNTSGAWDYAAWSEVTVSEELESVKGSLNPITISSYADITAFLNNNYDGFARLCYVPTTFMSTLSQGKTNAIGIGYIARANATTADFFFRVGFNLLWTVRVTNGATVQVRSFTNSNVITPNYEPSYNNISKAYSAGDLVIVNGYLVRITQAVAAGVTLVDGTNCVDNISVEDEINAATNYVSGDKIDVYDLQVTFSNSDGTFAEINMPTPKKIPDDATFGLATTNYWMRKFSDGVDVTGFSITVSKQTDHWLTIRFTVPSSTLGSKIPYVLHYAGSIVIV